MAAEPTQDFHDLASVHTHSLTELLKQLGISLAITTYQAGKLILVRADGAVTNTHFRLFDKPMGLALQGNRLAIGETSRIWRMSNVPAAAAHMEPAGKHDACFVPRAISFTGDIDIHEMAWADDELWFINTRFSCLCTLDSRYSFVPRWQPPFITAFDMRDRCHLNGLSLREGKPRYVTVLGVSDEPGGWRANKANGGILMDLEGDRILCEGLSMPHSPRWYRGTLWVLESGKGALLRVDPETGQTVTVAEMPGFTRGLDFFGDLAFIGLSQVRETAVFAGLPLTQTQPVRYSGVWVVNIHTGQIVAFLRFEKGVQEIFAVSVLPHRFPELINDDMRLIGGTYVLPDEALVKAVQPNREWEFAETHYEAGNTHFNAGRTHEAVSAYEKALSLSPDLLPARFNLAEALVLLERFAEAEALLRQVIDAEAGHAEALTSLGCLCHRQGRRQEAIDALEQALKIRPDHQRAKTTWLELTET